MSNTARFIVNQLSFSYGKKKVFESLSFSACQPEMIGLLGLNGAGKSTLLNIIAGILPVKPERLTLHHTSTTNPIGFLPERPYFYPELTIKENVEFSARINGVAKKNIQTKTHASLMNCQLIQIQKQLAGSLSKGYQQRLGLAMATVFEPILLLLDEPTDGLDPQQMIETHQLIQQIAKTSIVLISSHRLEEIKQLSDRLIILHNGKIVHDKSISDDEHSENLHALFQKLTLENFS